MKKTYKQAKEEQQNRKTKKDNIGNYVLGCWKGLPIEDLRREDLFEVIYYMEQKEKSTTFLHKTQYGVNNMKKGDKVEIIGGNNEIGQPTMIGKQGVVSSIDKHKYKVKGKETYIVYVDFKHFGTHCFNDYHLKTLL